MNRDDSPQPAVQGSRQPALHEAPCSQTHDVARTDFDREQLRIRAAHHLYVHVPFCARRCSYCDFAIAVRRTVPVDGFLQAINAEVKARGLDQSGIDQSQLDLATIYLGGGTPSLLGADGVRRLLDALRSMAVLRSDAEVTLEANPEDITADAVTAWRNGGVNRLSIGVQSFSDPVLRWMHRVHDGEGATRAIAIARDAGLSAFSLDLIFALPAALERDWARDLDLALALEPDHISLYGLTIESHTPLGRWRDRGAVAEAPDEVYEQEFLRAHERLSTAGFAHYEVSNFARPGRRAVHNSAYWTGAPYIGLGPSAHGFDGVTRRWNLSAFAEWSERAGSGADPVAGSEVLSEGNRVAEAVYLGLRTSDGLAVTDHDLPTVTRWLAAGWLEWAQLASQRSVRCTPTGWLRLDALAADLTALRSHS